MSVKGNETDLGESNAALYIPIFKDLKKLKCNELYLVKKIVKYNKTIVCT